MQIIAEKKCSIICLLAWAIRVELQWGRSSRVAWVRQHQYLGAVFGGMVGIYHTIGKTQHIMLGVLGPSSGAGVASCSAACQSGCCCSSMKQLCAGSDIWVQGMGLARAVFWGQPHRHSCFGHVTYQGFEGDCQGSFF